MISRTNRASSRGLAMIAQLRGDTGLPRRLGHQPGFMDRPGERLLAIDVFAQLERGHGDDGMRMVGRGHHHRVDLFFGQQFAIVAIGAAASVLAQPFLLGVELLDGAAGRFAARSALFFSFCPVPRLVTAALTIHVADGHHLDLGVLHQRGNVLASLSTQPDTGQGGFLAGGHVSRSA